MTFIFKLYRVKTKAPATQNNNGIFIKVGNKDKYQLVNIKDRWPEIQTYKKGLFASEFDHLVTSMFLMIDRLTGKVQADGSVELFRYLGIDKLSKNLEIGAQDNIFTEALQKAGYPNSTGIDIDPRILQSKFGRQINFRDFPLNEKFDVIYFAFIFDYFPGGKFNKTGTDPSLMLMASKIYAHLLPKGYLIFLEFVNNPMINKFSAVLKDVGFKQNNVQKEPWNIWRKP